MSGSCDVVLLDGESLTCDRVAAAARGQAVVAISAAGRDRAAAAAATVALIAGRQPVYGRTTGVGANRVTPVPADDPEYGMRLLRSHAVDAGDPLDDRTVRAMLAARLVQLCKPGAGLDPAILDGLVQMLNGDALPEILQYASIGTGDLAALAGTALTLIGERPASAPLTLMPPWGADSALPFMSSSALTIGRTCLALDELARLGAPPGGRPPVSSDADHRPQRDAPRPALRNGRGGGGATAKQLGAIAALARRNGADLDRLLRDDYGVSRSEDLSLAGASRLIDALRAAADA